MRRGLVGLITLLMALASPLQAVAEAACSRADFEAVVDEAAAALTTLNHENTPQFQARLRQLKDKRGWSHEQFLVEAAPFVRDDAIASFDQKSEDFLARITHGGVPQLRPAGRAARQPGSVGGDAKSQVGLYVRQAQRRDRQIARFKKRAVARTGARPRPGRRCH